MAAEGSSIVTAIVMVATLVAGEIGLMCAAVHSSRQVMVVMVVVVVAALAVVVPMQHAFSYTPYSPPHLSGGRERGSDRFDRDRPYGDRAPATQRPTLNLQPRCQPRPCS